MRIWDCNNQFTCWNVTDIKEGIIVLDQDNQSAHVSIPSCLLSFSQYASLNYTM